MNAKRNGLARALALLACCISLIAAHLAFSQSPDQPPPQKSAAPTDDQLLDRALCPIVYQVDRFLSPRGYRYLFYGNGFFINSDGYLLTDAHVLSQLHGGQPYILLHSPLAPPHFVQAYVVAVDREHDVAILRATPNPFASSDSVAFLPLALETTTTGEQVLAAALRPSRPRDAWSLEPVPEERSPGEILRFEFSQLEKGRPDTELFLFNHVVQLGQSGAPVISQDSHEVIGLIEGQWLRDNSTTFAAPNVPTPRNSSAASFNEATAVPGAVIPIHYAIALLQRRNIAWHGAEEDALAKQRAETTTAAPTPPIPLSLIPPPYPPQSLFGGEVLLDALVGRNGLLSDIKIIHGEPPFLEKALAATRTWTFVSARAESHAIEARIAITFQFPQPYFPPRDPTAHHYTANNCPATQDCAAVPITTVEPQYPSATNPEGTVILDESIDRDGKIASVQVLRELAPVNAATRAAITQWHFAPATHAGAAIDSTAIIVVTFRHPLATSHPDE
jgi:outer membrane biosynthesis protein TonB